MKDRIRQLMDSQHMTQQTFAQFIGISSASLSSIFNGRTNPTLNHVEAIRKKFPSISLEWLMFGSGEMFSEDGNESEIKKEKSTYDAIEPVIDFDTDSSDVSLNNSSDVGKQIVRNSDKNTPQTIVKYIDKPQREITDIRVFYNDQTWETFVPKK